MLKALLASECALNGKKQYVNKHMLKRIMLKHCGVVRFMRHCISKRGLWAVKQMQFC